MIQKNPQRVATIDDLYGEPGKAELVHGEIELIAPKGGLPGIAADEIYVSLRTYARSTKRGRAFADNKGFVVDLPNRRSFSPDAAYFIGKITSGFLRGASQFAVEVRSDNDYGPAAELAIAAKRADYFAAGTLAIWDVDLYSDDVVRLFTKDAPTSPQIFKRGMDAHAGDALPGWSMPVDEMFPDDDENAAD
jgi:Uma2 family endonuclease